MIDQITVFLENKRGRIASLCRTLGDANINMAALSVADTTEYGIVRIICSDTAAAIAALDAGGYSAETYATYRLAWELACAPQWILLLAVLSAAVII